MASHITTKLERKTTQEPKRHKVKPALRHTEIQSSLQDAIVQERAPTITELLDECKVLIGTNLISLRGAEDAYRASTAISNLVRAIATVSTAERVEEISDDVLKTMSVDELKAYTTKMLDKLN